MEWYYNALIGFLGVLGGVVGAKIITNYLTLRGGQYTLDKNKRRDVQEEQQQFIATLQAEYNSLRARMDKREQEERDRQREQDSYDAERARREADCEARYARAEERITALEDALSGAGIKFRPWVRPSGPPSGIVRSPQTPTKD